MLQLLLRATCIKLDWLLRFTTGKKCRRVFCNLWCTSRLVRVIVRPTWRGNELIQSRRLLLGIFLHTVGKSILSACLHFLPSWSSPNVINAFPAPRLWVCLFWFRKEGSKLFFCCLLVFSCPEQLNRWPCPLVPWFVCLTKLTIRVFTTLQSEPRELWPLRHLIRVMRRHDLTKKYLYTYIPVPTYPPSHPFTSIREHH